jgi:dihydrofolate synthase/folylpolyglutamate synthase
VVNFIQENKSFLELNKLSFFEMTVGMAFDFFSKEQVDIAIIEVGLGGRLDSTNVIMPLLSIITNIGMDHTQFLGDNLQKIAFEKAGIIKYNTPVVIGEYQEDIVHVFKEKASKMNSQISFANQLIRNSIECSLKGSYQKSNVKTAQLVLNILISKGFNISKSSLKLGFLNVQKSTGIKGRWQILGTQPKIICDTAHNKEGLSLVFNQLVREKFNNLHVVLGFVNDKSLDSITTIFPVNAQYYLCRPNIPRGLDSSELRKLFLRNNLKGKSYSSVAKAFSEAKTAAKKNDLIFVGGSTFVVAEVV